MALGTNTMKSRWLFVAFLMTMVVALLNHPSARASPPPPMIDYPALPDKPVPGPPKPAQNYTRGCNKITQCRGGPPAPASRKLALNDGTI
ncbi:hypothetical protein RHGRI_002688 [Rhododendron griersonianum]|uniref:Uncharacterized protein n=1 Tax=Rhododendron griersonianum TaxID=479676 RepID=A0AAV6LQQ8_9ERIC|nr:hypothetical protein RHGRI_002688 [Rhododendron griersonianum]